MSVYSYTSCSSSPSSSAPPLTCLIGTIVTPSTFWATEVKCPVTQSLTQKDHRLSVENDLGRIYKGEVPTLRGAMKEEEVVEGAMVAVRVTPTNPNWLRGQIVSLMFRPQGLFARVFLIDYGKYVQNLPVGACVRRLPKEQRKLKPQAFLLHLAGVRPLSLDLDYTIGMRNLSQIVSEEWNSKAFKIITRALSNCANKMVKVSDWVRDDDGSVYGLVELMGYKPKMFLHGLLVNAQCASFHPTTLARDLNTTISRDVSRKLYQKFSFVCSWSGRDKRNPMQEYKETMEFFRDEEEDKTMECVDVTPTNPPVQFMSGDKPDWITVKVKEINNNTEKRVISQSSDPLDMSSIWDSLRDTSISSSSTTFALPAGIDIGNYLQEQIRRNKDEGDIIKVPKKQNRFLPESDDDEGW